MSRLPSVALQRQPLRDLGGGDARAAAEGDDIATLSISLHSWHDRRDCVAGESRGDHAADQTWNGARVRRRSWRVTYKRSRRGKATIDRAVVHVLEQSGNRFEVEDFSPYGYDERQYCSPGFDLPVGVWSRTPHGCFPDTTRRATTSISSMPHPSRTRWRSSWTSSRSSRAMRSRSTGTRSVNLSSAAEASMR